MMKRGLLLRGEGGVNEGARWLRWWVMARWRSLRFSIWSESEDRIRMDVSISCYWLHVQADIKVVHICTYDGGLSTPASCCLIATSATCVTNVRYPSIVMVRLLNKLPALVFNVSISCCLQ